MLHIHYGNSVEALARQLIDSRSGRTGQVLRQDWLIVPHHEISRWLQLQAAGNDGIAANWNILQPGSAIWRLIHILNPEIPPHNSLDSGALSLRLYAALDSLASSGRYPRLSRFMSQSDDRRQLAFSRQLAALFDQYLMYRPDMILDWQQGGRPPSDAMQAELWQHVAEPHEWHWARALNWLADQDKDQLASSRVLDALPARIDFFFLHTLSPGLMSAVEHVARLTEFNLYQWTPADHYWSQARSSRSGRLPEPSSVPSSDSAHPLLVSMGTQLREITELLTGLDSASTDHFLDFSDGKDLLSRLRQQMMMHMADMDSGSGLIELTSDQVNIAIHSCHSKRREIEICHDQLRHLMEQHDELNPHQILVVSSDLEPYVPYIRSIFGEKGNQALPWRVVSRTSAYPLAHDLLDILEQLAGNNLRQTLFERVSVDPVLNHFDLSTDDVTVIESWLTRYGLFHSGLGGLGEQDQRNEQTDAGKFSWRSGMQRLMTAALRAGDPQTRRHAGLSDMSSGDLSLVFRFGELVATLYRLHRSCQRRRVAAEWQRWLISAIRQLTGERDETLTALQPVFDVMQDISSESSADSTFDCLSLIDQIRYMLGERKPLSEGISAGITFADAAHTRLMPAKVIYALGLNDREFPSPDQRFELDLIARQPRLGDRTRRLQDRELFLEWLLSARTYLMLSYEGHHPRDNSERAATPLIPELLSCLDSQFSLNGAALSSQLITHHPPQPFSTRYNREAGLISYNGSFCLPDDRQAVVTEMAFSSQLDYTDAEPMTSVSIQSLLQFIQNPASIYLRDGLGINLQRTAVAQSDDPPAGLDPLNRFILTRDVIDMSESQAAHDELLQHLRSAVSLPPGKPGDVQAAQVLHRAAASISRAADLAGPGVEDESFTISLSHAEITGVLDSLHVRGRVELLAGKMRPKHKLASWLMHLVLSQLRDIGAETFLVDQYQRVSHFEPVAEPMGILDGFVDLYQQARSRPLPFFPASSEALVSALRRSAARESQRIDQLDPIWHSKAMQSAVKVYHGNAHQPGEASDPWMAQAFRGNSWWQDDAGQAEFTRLAIGIWLPLMESSRG